jgi:hypothetical protein
MHRQHASHIFIVVLLCLFGSSIAKASSCSITSFGAVGDGVTNNAGAIQKTFSYAAANHCTALIPDGTSAYSGNITAIQPQPNSAISMQYKSEAALIRK